MKESVLGEPSQKIRLIEKEPEFPSVSDKNDQMNDLKKNECSPFLFEPFTWLSEVCDWVRPKHRTVRTAND